MSRRSTPAKTHADQTFPLVIYLRIPEGGLSKARVDPHHWLARNVPSGDYALHAAGRPSRDAFAVYFRRVEDLLAFISAHQQLALADDVK